MMSEIYRILAPGSRYITFSLHSIEENRKHFEKSCFSWKTSFFRVKSSRWKDTDECYQRAVAHTMIVCDKPLFHAKTKKVTYYNKSTYPLEVNGVLEESEYLSLKAEADKVCYNVLLWTLVFVFDLLSVVLKFLVFLLVSLDSGVVYPIFY